MKIEKIVEKGKHIKKDLLGIGLLLLPYVMINSCDNNIYALTSGEREYFECAALRTLNARKNALQGQKEIYENIKEFLR